MANQSPMILGTPDAIALRKRMEKLEAQMEALLDGMAAMSEAVKGLSDVIDQHDAQIKNVAVCTATTETEVQRQKDSYEEFKARLDGTHPVDIIADYKEEMAIHKEKTEDG